MALVPEIEVQGEIEAPPERVWDLLADHRGWGRWAGFREVVLRQQGDPPPNGLGAIRVIRSRGLAVEEEIVAFEPPARLAYQVVAGLPIRAHRAEVLLEPTPSGTRALWHVRFAASIPATGGLVARAYRRELRRLLARLQSHATGG